MPRSRLMRLRLVFLGSCRRWVSIAALTAVRRLALRPFRSSTTSGARTIANRILARLYTDWPSRQIDEPLSHGHPALPVRLPSGPPAAHRNDHETRSAAG